MLISRIDLNETSLDAIPPTLQQSVIRIVQHSSLKISSPASEYRLLPDFIPAYKSAADREK